MQADLWMVIWASLIGTGLIGMTVKKWNRPEFTYAKWAALILLEGSSPQGVLVLKFSECSSNAVECKSHLIIVFHSPLVKWLHLILWSSQILL